MVARFIQYFMHYIIEDYLSVALVANQTQNRILAVRVPTGFSVVLCIVLQLGFIRLTLEWIVAERKSLLFRFNGMEDN